MDITHLVATLTRDDVPAYARVLCFLDHADTDVLDRYAARVRREYPAVDSAIGYYPHVDANADAVTDTYIDIALDRASVMTQCEPITSATHRDTVLSAALAAGYAELATIAILSLYSTLWSRQYRDRAAIAAEAADSPRD